jgi:mono/diheme cytochrome c family protein
VHLSELHGAATHLSVVAIPLYCLLMILRRLGHTGVAVTAWEPWALAAAVVGVALAGLTGLLVRGQSQTELRGPHYGIGGIHFWLGIALAVLVLILGTLRMRDVGAVLPTMGLTALAVVAVAYQGYLGGRMTYDRGVGVQALGEARASAAGARRLEVALASGASPAAAGRRAFTMTGLGCASCHGDQAQGGRGPRLAGGKHLDEFRRVHAAGLFPASVVSDRDFAAINAWLATLGPPEAGGH